jgi:hypothetical protein
MKLILACTGSSLDRVAHLLESISRNNHSVDVLVVAVLQKGLQLDTVMFDTSFTKIKCIHENNQVGLSLARNKALELIGRNNIGFDHIMFPDDDSTFDAVFFERYNQVVGTSQNYLIDVFCEGSSDLYVKNKFDNGAEVDVRNYHAAMSVNMIISRKLLEQVGLFNEELGVGAKYGSAEDSDYFIRCLKICGYFLYSKQLYNYHPSPKNKYSGLSLREIVKRFKNYGNGVVYVLTFHKLYGAAVKICARAIGGFILSFLRFRFKLGVAYLISFFFRISIFTKQTFSNIISVS